MKIIIIIIYIRFFFHLFLKIYIDFSFCFNNIDYKFLLHHFQIDFTFQINWRHRMTLVSYFKPLSETQWTILVVLNSLFDISKVELLWDFLIDTWYLSLGLIKKFTISRLIEIMFISKTLEIRLVLIRICDSKSMLFAGKWIGVVHLLRNAKKTKI